MSPNPALLTWPRPVAAGGYPRNGLTNGDFSDGDTGWTVQSGWSIGSGVATYGDAITSRQIKQGVTLPAGHQIYIGLDAAIPSGNTSFQVQLSAEVPLGYANRAAGFYSVIHTLGADAEVFRVYGRVASTSAFTVDNIVLVDLTDAFGAGSEPDIAWCNANIPAAIIF